MKPQGSSVTEAEQNFIIFTSLVLLVIGFLYAGMGLCFVKRWRDSNLAKYRTMRAHAEMADELQGDPSLAPPPRV